MIDYTLLIAEIITAILIVYKGKMRLFLGLLYNLIISIQITSLFTIKQFLPAIALANFNYVGKISSNYKPFLIFAISFLTILSLQIFTIRFKNKKISNLGILFFIIICFVSGSTINSLITQAKIIYDSNFVYLDKKTQNEIIKSLKKDNIVYDSNISSYIKPEKYNVVLFFIEGFPQIAISKELTPNLYKIEQLSINVINYYNHTATTYRGMRGQLTSFYQASSGLTFQYKNKADKILTSLPRILNSLGYDTAHQSCENNYTKMSKSFYAIGYKHIIGYNYVYPNKVDKAFPSQLTDTESYKLAFDEIHKLHQPFFYSLYSVGTHYGYNPRKTAIKYKDNKNRILTAYHNVDAQIGKFFDKFNKDPLSNNTILIITADHSAVSGGEDFSKAFPNNHANNSMVDRIPLIIYKKGITPAIVDAKNLNSLSLAPTICDILGIKKYPNIFLGLSIFDKKPHRIENYISVLDDDMYVIDHNYTKLLKEDNNNSKIIERIKQYRIFGG